MKDLIISVVAPVHNQCESIADFIRITVAVLAENFQNYELILVDDGSSDGTSDIICGALADTQNIRHIVLSRHYGHEIALTAGLDHAIGDYVVLMESTFQDPPELIPELVTKAQDGHDVVYVSREAEEMRPFLRRMAASLFYKITARMTGFSLPEEATEFRVLSRRAVNSITRLKEHNRYMKMLYAYVGYQVSSVPYRPSRHRAIGRSKYSYKERLKLALDAIIAFSDKPLRYVAILSIIISFAAFMGSVWVFLERLYSDQVVAGWASLMVLQLLMFSILFLFLGVISEYISRILVESKHRPLYYVREEHGGTNFKIDSIVDFDQKARSQGDVFDKVRRDAPPT